MKRAILSLLAVAALTTIPNRAAEKQMFTGIITDSMCPNGNHSGMRMGPTEAECTVACVMIHDALYMLYDGEVAYTLSDQKTPETFAAQKVTVVGTLDAKTHTIQVESIAPAK